MSPGRIVTAGIVGGVVMFIWGALSHMALGIGDMGMKSLPGEDVVMPAMKSSISERGFYMFPAMDENDTSEAAMKAWEEKYKQGPRGIVVFDPQGGEAMSPMQLGTELASNIVAALFAAIILARIGTSRFGRTMMGTAIGLVAWLSIDASYWNWYRFPDLFTMSQLIDQTAGWFLTGGTIALVLPKPGVSKAFG